MLIPQRCRFVSVHPKIPIPAEARLHAEDGLGHGREEAEVGADKGALEEVVHVEGEEVGVERHQLEGEISRVHHLGQALLLDEGAQGGQALFRKGQINQSGTRDLSG